VPYPYWPPREHFGFMRSGGAVLSRWPIIASDVELLPKPRANAWWYNFFYLFRYLQRCEVDVDGTRVLVFNTHLEAFDRPNRVEQAEHVRRRLSREATRATIFGGDFNSAPPEARLRGNYPDEPQTSHESDRTVEVLRSIPRLRDASDDPELFTFPAHAPNRRLDYLLVGDTFSVEEIRVVREAGDVSDHLPIVARLAIR
jgi:endonuclease/exonuclease/phosphatase family metal-dependent hydrolase